MKNSKQHDPNAFVLAVHPSGRGFGWALFESPSSVVDWGITEAREDRNKTLLRRFERLVKRYQPQTLALEAFDPSSARRAARVQNLCQGIVRRAEAQGADARVYSRSAVQATFAGTGAATRHEIAEVIARNIEAFSHRLPKKRRPWDNEDPRQSLFDAAALALTHYAAAKN